MVGLPRQLALAFLVISGCSDECHDIGCGSALIVELAPADGFVDGTYDVELSSPRGTESCSFVIADAAAKMLSCTPGEASLDPTELPAYVLVRYQQDYYAETLSVTVARDGAALTSQDFEPAYQDMVVDAHACGGSCVAAQVSVAF
jgi:hypothetical protein